MVTNDKRREIAARLREAEANLINIPMPKGIVESSSVYFRELTEALGEHEETLFNYLADLIEPEPVNGETSDGYHTFNELYHHRALLFSVIVRNYPELCWKSKKHHDGDMYDGMFIVGINTPDGQASYHYDIEPYWDMFDCKELEFAPEWDGHTPSQAIERISKLSRHIQERTCKMISLIREDDSVFSIKCSECGYTIFSRSGKYNRDFCLNCGAKVVK